MSLDLDAIEARATAARLLRGGELTVTDAEAGRWRVVCSDSEYPDAVAACDQPVYSALVDSHDTFAYDCCEVVAETAHPVVAAHVAGMDPRTTIALAAELRAARAVVEAVKGWMALPFGAPELGGMENRVLDALDAYDQAATATATVNGGGA